MKLEVVFDKLRSLLIPYENGYTIKTNDSTTYYLENKQESAKSKPVMFAAVMIKKNYVSMYYMPVYYEPELLSGISDELKKHMQGKSCFNFTNENDSAIDELSQLIKRTAARNI